jgi:diacylglycerol kinase family enzyme
VPAAGADFARAVSAAPAGGPVAMDLPCDALRLTAPGTELLAVNAVVLGTAPDRQRRFHRSSPLRVVVDGRVVHDGPATAVVIGNGQFLRGNDVIPRGHPGDGRAEVQVYAVPGRDRGAMRGRLARGEHLPHPGIHQTTGRRIAVTTGGHRLRLEVDGHPPRGRPNAARFEVAVVPGAFTLVT